MKHNTSRLAPSLGAALTLLGVPFHAQAQVSEETLPQPATGRLPETIVVTPAKFPLSAEEVGSAITVIPGNDLEARQVRTFEDALKLATGVAFASTGQPGSISSIFLRGVNSNQTQFLVDGIRISDTNILSGPFVGAGMAHNLSRIEVLRGPQSALYGGEAIGGVISLWSARGMGDPSSQFDVQAGSFGTFASQFSSQGESGPLAYSLSLGWDTTENDRPNNDFENLYYAGRFDYALSERTTFGVTFRGANREFQSPGSVYENDPDNYDTDFFLLTTAYLDHQVNDVWNTHLLAGWLNQDYDSYFPPGGVTNIDNEKVALDWRNTLAWRGGHTSLLGIGYEHNAVSNNGFGEVDDEENLFSLYAQQLWQVSEALSLTGGVRWEDYDSFGQALTWRGTGAYHVEPTGTTFRASAGTGFRAPSFFELYARNAFFVGNPELDPEESFGWDAGVEQQVGGLGSLAVTYFQNDLQDLITTDFSVFPSSVVNLEEASTSGVEVEWRGDLCDRVLYHLAYTYLEAENDTQGVRLLRRPAHTLGFDVRTLLGDRLTVGMGGYWVYDRLDVDALTFATIAGDDYFLARFYGDFRLCQHAELHLRVENAFDAKYDEVNGYPGRGLGVFGGVRIRF